MGHDSHGGPVNAPEILPVDARAPAGSPDDFPDIGDYAAIGNCRTLALVAKNGAVEWLCLPTFSSPSIFAAILDRGAGHFSVRPVDACRVSRAYVPGTNVLETTFHCEGGALKLTDCMTLPPEPSGDLQPGVELEPEHELLRRVECTSGEVEVEVSFAPRGDYGRAPLRFVKRGRLGWQCLRCGFGAFLNSELDLAVDEAGRRLRGRARLRAGECRWLSFCYDGYEIGVTPPLADEARRRLEATIGWWQWWSRHCRYQGPHRDAMLRSALALKLLTCATSGAVLAAPTTSLPEEIGGPRNWDYRYCWIRDSALVLDAFFSLGFVGEGDAFLGWLLHATRLTWPRLQVMYDMYGETRLTEKELPHLSGYRGSRPVRVGNGAHGQLQLDIYGELVATAWRYVESGGELDPGERRMLAGLCRSVTGLWRLPDHGIWEARREPRHHTHSKAMCWVAMDRLGALDARLSLGLDRGVLERERVAIREQIESRGFNRELGAYVGYFDGDEPDASLLLLARHGYLEPGDPRMEGTYRFLEKTLSSHGMLHRYLLDTRYDGIQAPENVFAPCSFWAAEYLANAGRRQQAEALFERLLGCANDVGLFAEEIEAASGTPVGNFPQAFTHVSMISTGMALYAGKTA
jgi:GH15 family glucan-1,4-alpha-glucosidase